MGYYQTKKHGQYHQETKGTVRHVFRIWYRKGQSLPMYINTQRAPAPQPAWEEWEEQANGIWQTSFQKEATYRRVKEEVQHYTDGPGWVRMSGAWPPCTGKQSMPAAGDGRKRKIPPPPLSFPTPCPSPVGGWGTVTCSSQNFSLQLTVLLWQNHHPRVPSNAFQ